MWSPLPNEVYRVAEREMGRVVLLRLSLASLLTPVPKILLAVCPTPRREHVRTEFKMDLDQQDRMEKIPALNAVGNTSLVLYPS